jgi:signal transduction histidine kinase
MNRIFLLLLALAASCSLLPLEQSQWARNLTNAILVVIFILAVVLSVIRLLSGFRPARVFVLAWTPLLFLSGFSMLNLPFQWLPDYKISSYIPFAFLLEMFLMSLALADRINIIRSTLIDKMKTHDRDLQELVKEKTNMLRATNDRLLREIEERAKADKIINQQKEMVFESEKFRSLNKMAGGVAHEINNPLAIIIASCQQVESLEDQENSELTSKSIHRIHSAALRIAKIVKSLILFSTEESNHSQVRSNLRDLINESIEISRTVIDVGVVSINFSSSQGAPIWVSVSHRDFFQFILCLLNWSIRLALSNSLESPEVNIALSQDSGGIKIDILNFGSWPDARMSSEMEHCQRLAQRLGGHFYVSNTRNGVSFHLQIHEPIKSDKLHSNVGG